MSQTSSNTALSSNVSLTRALNPTGNISTNIGLVPTDLRDPTVKLDKWRDPSQPTKLYTSITVSSMSAVDTLEQTLPGKFWIDCWWQVSEEEKEKWDDSTEVKPDLDLLEQFQPVNAVSVDDCSLRKEATIITTEFGEDNDRYERYMWHSVVNIEGQFKQSMLLHTFPFDAHSMVIKFEGQNVKKVVFCPMPQRDVLLSVETQYCPMAGWNWMGLELWYTQSDKALSKSHNAYTQLVMEFKLSRMWSPFFWRYTLLILLLSFSGMTVFGIAPAEVGDRLGTVFTLALTIVAFQSVIIAALPPSPYLTLMEKYMMWSTVLITAIGIESGVMGYLSIRYQLDGMDEEEVAALLEYPDNVCFFVYVALWVVLHVYGAIYASVVRKRNIAKLYDRVPGSSRFPPKNQKLTGEGLELIPEVGYRVNQNLLADRCAGI